MSSPASSAPASLKEAPPADHPGTAEAKAIRDRLAASAKGSAAVQKT
ncbi:MAG TPA: hypothetical protein VKP69_03845 [Isosphaeraceae bacterium]|nr:hypothetical protein [Isosphaeraceae bacterium]